jgi:hypothetical protein
MELGTDRDPELPGGEARYWFEEALDARFTLVRRDIKELKIALDDHSAPCERRFTQLERRVGAPSRWMKSKLKEIVDEGFRVAIKAGAVVVLTFMGVHFWP